MTIDDNSEDERRLIFDDVFRGLRFARPVWMAFKVIRVQRLKAFMRGLEGAVDQLPREDRLRFDSYINSQTGAELLADFADHVVRSRSTTVLAALAILYAHPEADRDRKAETALALEGLSEKSIDAFLLLSGVSWHTDEAGGVFISNEDIASQPSLNLSGWGDSDWVTAIDDLVGRGLLEQDFAANKLAGDWTWYRRVRVTQRTEWYRNLLSSARRQRDTTSILGL